MELFVVLYFSVDIGLPVIDKRFWWTSTSSTGSKLYEFFLTDHRILFTTQSTENLVLNPRKSKICKCNELLNTLKLMKCYPSSCAYNNLGNDSNDKFIISQVNCFLCIFVLMKSQISSWEFRPMYNIIDCPPKPLI